MKTRLVKLAACFYVLVGLAFTAQIHAAEYYIFQDPQGKLVISNQKPPPGSKNIKQRTYSDTATDEAPPSKNEVKIAPPMHHSGSRKITLAPA